MFIAFAATAAVAAQWVLYVGINSTVMLLILSVQRRRFRL